MRPKLRRILGASLLGGAVVLGLALASPVQGWLLCRALSRNDAVKHDSRSEIADTKRWPPTSGRRLERGYVASRISAARPCPGVALFDAVRPSSPAERGRRRGSLPSLPRRRRLEVGTVLLTGTVSLDFAHLSLPLRALVPAIECHPIFRLKFCLLAGGAVASQAFPLGRCVVNIHSFSSLPPSAPASGCIKPAGPPPR